MIQLNWQCPFVLAAVLLLLPELSVADGLARAAQVITSTDVPTPAEAQAQGHYGTVGVAGVIDESGSIVDLTVSQSSRSPILDAAALSGVSKWKFTPALDPNGQPVSKKFRTEVEFDPLDLADLPLYTCQKVTVETVWYMQAFPEKGNNESRMYSLLRGMGAILGRGEIPSDPAQFKKVWDKTIDACRTLPRAPFVKKFVEQAR
ncbi:energy transducer TonB [Caulobacter sp. ErkDOM-E]|uniref:energy transducer TonB n=1 Tax=Caulobacter sp. ErkDOM-E TaxID=3402778 RepID=UPI003AF5BBA6